jgi:ribonuclease T2
MKYINLAKSFLDKIRSMNKLYIIFLTMITLVAAEDISARAIHECGAYNNLKHTKNNNDIRLSIGSSYAIKQDHKNNYLISMDGAYPKQRWVYKSCFDAKITAKGRHRNKENAKQYILALGWYDGFCAAHKNKKECQQSFFNKKEYGFVLHGLWPQPKNNQYCGVDNKNIGIDKNKQWHLLPEVKLTEQTKSELSMIMPTVASNLERHEWIKHGSCSGLDSEIYYKTSILIAKEFMKTPLALYINKQKGKTVNLSDIRKLSDISFGNGSSEKIEMVCDSNRNLTEIRLSMGSIDGGLRAALANGLPLKSSCREAIIKDIE